MAGYNGYSMSNNAVDAYDDGEKPMSKWTKVALLDAIREEFDGLAGLEKLTAKRLRSEFLIRTSWHHTSSHFNQTDFYSVDFDKLAETTAEDVEKWRKEDKERSKAEEKSEPEKSIRKVSYLVWGGTRKHPKATEHVETCEVVGNWAMTQNGKKSIFARGFAFLD